MSSVFARRQRGFTLIEALIALLVMAFGMLALAGMQVQLSRNGDYAKQRAEALRLAQDRMERLRAYDGIATGTIQWNNLPVGAETFAGNTNTTFTVSAALAGTTTDTQRPLTVTVTWPDRTGATQTLALSSVVARTDPIDLGLVANPLPLNQPLRRPKNRNINIPIPAIDLGGGQSATQFDANYAIIYSNASGNVVRICDPGVANATAAQINAIINTCITTTGYIVAGYMQRSSNTIAWPTGIAHSITRTVTPLSLPIRCLFADATNQNTGAVIAGFKYYLCVIPIDAPSDGTAARWSGTIRFSGVNLLSDYVVCRYQYTQTDLDSNERNIQPYTNVSKSIDEQNYWITSSNSGTVCNALNVSGVSTGVLHQNCRTSNAANHLTACPVLPGAQL